MKRATDSEYILLYHMTGSKTYSISGYYKLIEKVRNDWNTRMASKVGEKSRHITSNESTLFCITWQEKNLILFQATIDYLKKYETIETPVWQVKWEQNPIMSLQMKKFWNDKSIGQILLEIQISEIS